MNILRWAEAAESTRGGDAFECMRYTLAFQEADSMHRELRLLHVQPLRGRAAQRIPCLYPHAHSRPAAPCAAAVACTAGARPDTATSTPACWAAGSWTRSSPRASSEWGGGATTHAQRCVGCHSRWAGWHRGGYQGPGARGWGGGGGRSSPIVTTEVAAPCSGPCTCMVMMLHAAGRYGGWLAPQVIPRHSTRQALPVGAVALCLTRRARLPR